MKKLLLSLTALSVMMLSVSCNREGTQTRGTEQGTGTEMQEATPDTQQGTGMGVDEEMEEAAEHMEEAGEEMTDESY